MFRKYGMNRRLVTSLCAGSLLLCSQGAMAGPLKRNGDVTLSFIDSKGPYQDCWRNMEGHRQPHQAGIKVCIRGNGFYSQRAIHAARDADWFPGISNVEEVRFVCALELKKIPRDLLVLFPTQAELATGRGIRIEIPCDFDGDGARLAMLRAKKLILAQLNEPVRTARQSLAAVDRCGPDPGRLECLKEWRKSIQAIFAGEAVRPLSAPASYHGTQFNAGLSSEASAGPSSPFDAVTNLCGVDLSAPRGADGALAECLSKRLIECDKPQNKEENVKGCWAALGKIRSFLEKNGVDIRADEVAFKDENCAKYRSENVKMPGFCRAAYEVQRLMLESMLARSTLKSLKELTADELEDLENAYSLMTNGGSAMQRMRIGSEGARFYYSADFKSAQDGICGWDATCWREVSTLSDAIEQAAYMQKPGCYEPSVDFRHSPPAIRFLPATGCDSR